MLHLAPAAIADIRSAAQAGLTITTHEKRLHINGYTGEGYIILNEMGDGAYLINGGLYGGFIAWHQGAFIAAWACLTEKALQVQTVTTFFGGTIFSGLGLASDLLDLMALYNGTPACMSYIIMTFAFEMAIVFLTITFGPVGAMVLSILEIMFHNAMKPALTQEYGPCEKA